jgi:hypothetical protein
MAEGAPPAPAPAARTPRAGASRAPSRADRARGALGTALLLSGIILAAMTQGLALPLLALYAATRNEAL